MAAAEVGLEERSQSRGGGGGDADAGFDGAPDCHVRGGVQEILDVGEIFDVGDADDCCGRGAGRGVSDLWVRG